MNIEFRRLTEVVKSEIIALMNHPLVLRHIPLAKGHFDERECDAFIAYKEGLWEKHGYGPWAFFIDGSFAGWGGLQYEEGEPDLALVLHPQFWGIGKKIYDLILHRAFGELGFESITVLLPPSRMCMKTIARLNLTPDGELYLQGQQFFRYRLFATDR